MKRLAAWYIKHACICSERMKCTWGYKHVLAHMLLGLTTQPPTQLNVTIVQDFWSHHDEDGNEVQLDADKSAFQVRFIVSSPGQRDVEGRFDPETVMRILEHFDAEESASNVATSLGTVQARVSVNA